MAIARIEAQMVYVSDFQLLFIARVLGVGLLDLYPTIGPEDDLYDTVTELRKPRKFAAPNRRRRKTNGAKKARSTPGSRSQCQQPRLLV